MFIGASVVEGGRMWIGGHAFSCNDRKRGQNHVASDGDREQYVDTVSQKGRNGRRRVKGRRRQGENLRAGRVHDPSH